MCYHPRQPPHYSVKVDHVASDFSIRTHDVEPHAIVISPTTTCVGARSISKQVSGFAAFVINRTNQITWPLSLRMTMWRTPR